MGKPLGQDQRIPWPILVQLRSLPRSQLPALQPSRKAKALARRSALTLSAVAAKPTAFQTEGSAPVDRTHVAKTMRRVADMRTRVTRSNVATTTVSLVESHGVRMGPAGNAPTGTMTIAKQAKFAAATTTRTTCTSVAQAIKLSAVWLGVRMVLVLHAPTVRTAIVCLPWFVVSILPPPLAMRAARTTPLLITSPHVLTSERLAGRSLATCGSAHWLQRAMFTPPDDHH